MSVLAVSILFSRMKPSGREEEAYMNAGRSLYSVLSLKRSGSVWLVVPMITALPSVPRAAKARMTRSAMEMLLFTLGFGASAFGDWPSSTDSTFILISSYLSWFDLSCGNS